MDGDHDQFEEIDDDLLSSIPLDFPHLQPHDQEPQVTIPDEFPFPFQPYDIQVRRLFSFVFLVSIELGDLLLW